ncbi:peroxiredoxin [Telluribacter sp. SYSU D00476]|uniref:peroxiredoxin family protein n=1 Tax=Telluribacter sp. SYSU D00476 TaxID=2811430 RepID=UPI001FF2FBA2|nr:TlpA disulfide reductase family protein [Telluribacter sp. SYSU D00476]
MVKFLLVLVVWTSTLSFSSAQEQLPRRVPTSPFTVGTDAPSLTFNTIDGRTISLDHMKGEVIVLNFWNIGSKGREMERETMNKMSERLKSKGVRFVAITMNGGEQLKTWLTKYPVKYEVLEKVDFMNYTGPNLFGFSCMPTTIVIDRDGRVRYNRCGAIATPEEAAQFIALLSAK